MWKTTVYMSNLELKIDFLIFSEGLETIYKVYETP